MSQIAEGYECKYCHRHFIRETAYLKHHCKIMDREKQLQTPIGQAALSFYGDWFRCQRRLVPNAKTFRTSKYYNAFIKFATFVRDVHIADPTIFIKMMVDRGMPPMLWTNDQAYALYLEYLEKKLTPMEQVKLSLKTMLNLADRTDCDISEVFEKITPNEIMQLIRERKLTPWLLLNSRAFRVMFQKSSPEQRKIFEDLIRPPYWNYKFNKDPASAAKIKKFIADLDI